MNTRLSQDAADAMQWHERQARHKQGYGPRPSAPITGYIVFPPLTAQEQAERAQQISTGALPF